MAPEESPSSDRASRPRRPPGAARSWPRTGSRPIEPIFVAAGGQRLDHAGSRELVRLLETEWPGRPSLLILLFAPGEGDLLWLSTCEDPAWPHVTLVEDAARSLWDSLSHGP